MPSKKPAAKPTFAQRAKAAFNAVSNALDPVQQLTPAAQKKMKQVRERTGGPAREREGLKEADRQSGYGGGMASRRGKSSGRRNA